MPSVVIPQHSTDGSELNILAGDQLHRDFLRRLLGVHSGTPNVAVLAEVGRYPMVVKAAKHLCNFWNRLVEMEDERLVK